VNGAAPLSEGERQRILRVMGIDSWQRRSGDYRPQRAGAGTTAARVERAAAAPTAAVSPAVAEPRVFAELPPARAPTAAPRSPAVPLRAQAVMLVLEKRVHADLKLIRHLTLALPGATICTADTVAGGAARFAVQLGVDARLPADVLGLRVPGLAELQRSASARRALWWSIKPVLRALRV
jgi:small ligand-binding sensory domain FIST